MTKENTKNVNIQWATDRGVDILSSPWYPIFHSDRINDYLTTLAEKAAVTETTRC